VRKYGDIDESDHVHDEIKEVGANINKALRARAPADAAGVLAQVKMFGPSAESKAMLRREREAAIAAIRSGTYVTYRCMDPPRGKQLEDCFRVGPTTLCFCGHSLAEHPQGTRKSGGKPPACGGCACPGFSYVPSTPEEIGENWLRRRANFDLSTWFPKCRCGHGPAHHDPKTRKCRACACFRFEGQFACLICDLRYEEHVTYFESEAERAQQGLPTGADFAPLAREDPELQELVFGHSDGRNALEAPPPFTSSGQPRLAPAPAATGPGSSARAPVPRQQGPSAAQPRRIIGNPFGDAPAPATECPGCYAPYRTATSKFCSNCGRKRE
jgi:hypothetical protein